jgi:ElaB/YqjD/DUF883 family membrane-anchored ribosome-binding protein
MNDAPKNETETIRSDIDTTRRRMDDTMDALGDRLQPRHLLDEFLGYLRGSGDGGESRLKHAGERIGHSCNHAMHSVVDSIKQNPMPAVLIGAGVAWMIYSSRRDQTQRYDFEDYTASDAARRYDPDTHYDRPLDYPPSGDDVRAWNRQGEPEDRAMQTDLAGKASSVADQAKEKLAHAGEAAREKISGIRERAGEVSERMRERTRATYDRARERVISTADHHPLEVGLVALAAGLIAGLAIPTPNAINRSLGPSADRLRRRTRDAGNEMIQKGKRVAEAAMSAVKEEAEAQGLTPEHLRGKAAAVAERGKEAGEQAASREGVTTSRNEPANSPTASDPTVARPGM